MKQLPEYISQHLSHGLEQLIQPLLRNTAVRDWNWAESDYHDAVL